MKETKNKKPRVAVATGDTRENTVRNAIALVSDDILAEVKGRVIIKPNFLSSVNALASTQVEAVRPLVEILKGADINEIFIAEGGSRSTAQAIDNFGYRELAEEFDVEFIDLNHSGFSQSFEIITSVGGNQTVEYTDFITETDTIISVPVAKTHDTASVTLSVKNMMGCLKRVHRPRMHGIVISDGLSRFGEFIWDMVEGHPFVVKSFSSVVFGIARLLRAFDSFSTQGRDDSFLQQVGAMSENIARLGSVLMPDIAVIDAFKAMEGDGPGGNGTPVDMRIAVAGTDPVACDAVMAYLMGFNPLDIGYLCLLNERDLGVADMEKIEIAGEDPSKLIHNFKPHSNFKVQKRWREACVI